MLALIVKPSLRGKSRFTRVLSDIANLDPVILSGVDADSLRTEIAELIREDSNLTVVACGGDGTFHLALNSIPNLDIPLAVIPMGTGNDFARYLKVKKVANAISTLQTGDPRQMDMGTIQLESGRIIRFAGIASCGFDAQVNERANTFRGPAGTLKYLVALAVELIRLKSWNLSVSLDGASSSNADFTLIAVGNTSSYGGGLRMCPTADAFDQLFEVTFVDRVSRGLLVRVLPKVFWGGHTKHKQVTQSAHSSVRISGEPFPVYADGERVGIGPATIVIHPGAMRVWQAQVTPTP
jgi:diacylglycerol kinase (ATP)